MSYLVNDSTFNGGLGLTSLYFLNQSSNNFVTLDDTQTVINKTMDFNSNNFINFDTAFSINYSSDVFSYTLNSTDITISYNHNLGKTPKNITFFADYNVGATNFFSNGTYNNSGNKCSYVGDSIWFKTDKCFYISVISSTDWIAGEITDVNSTTFSIKWTKLETVPGSPVIRILWNASG